VLKNSVEKASNSLFFFSNLYYKKGQLLPLFLPLQRRAAALAIQTPRCSAQRWV
jgi:hypothetical protein